MTSCNEVQHTLVWGRCHKFSDRDNTDQIETSLRLLESSLSHQDAVKSVIQFNFTPIHALIEVLTNSINNNWTWPCRNLVSHTRWN